MDDEHTRQLPPAPSSAREMLDSQRSKAGFDTMFPEGEHRKRGLINFVARFVGPVPDAYAYLRLGGELQLKDHIRSKAIAVLIGNGHPPPPELLEAQRQGVGAHSFDWSRVSNHPLQYALEDLTISMGGGKGRKEGVEMSKSNPPQETKARWSWGRK
jgi:hypothetical protein